MKKQNFFLAHKQFTLILYSGACGCRRSCFCTMDRTKGSAGCSDGGFSESPMCRISPWR